MNNISKTIVVVIAVVVLVAAAYFIGHNSSSQMPSTSTPAASNTNTQSVPQSPQAENQASPSSVGQSQPQQKSLADITAEWQGSTAYIVCDWNVPSGDLQEDSGSGLLATLNSIPTIITNKHVVYSPQYGYATHCDIKFPNDDGGYIYTNQDYVGYGSTGYFQNYGNLTVDSNGYDVAYITGMYWVHLIGSSSALTTTPPSISLSDRSQNGSFACNTPESTGDSVLVLGYPINGPQINEYGDDTEPTVTDGIISGTDGVYYTTSAKVDSGNSGGLVIDETNDCYVGIPTWDESGNFGSLARILPVSTFLHY